MPGSLLSQLAAQRLKSDPELAERARVAVTTTTLTAVAGSSWSLDSGHYVNRETGRLYTPHHDDERRFVYTDTPRRALAKGGEGGGKSVAGVIKDLERLRRGMHGMMGSPDFEHFKKSLWPEFRRWCPWQHVTQRHQYKAMPDWEPSKPFMLAFENGATLLCGGFDEPGSWEGPNVHFAHFDEARRHKTPAMLKVMDGRCRLTGPHGEPPQNYYTTTPRKHWLFEYFGPWETPDESDPLADFKKQTLVIDLLTVDNAANLAAGYVEDRRQSLTEAEARVLLEAAWEDVDDVDRFLASISLWDACRDPDLPPLGPHEPCVLAMDAGESSDTFATVLISMHPISPERLAVRYARPYVPKGGLPLDFDAIELDIRDLVDRYAVQQIAYDPFLLGQMMRRLSVPGRMISAPLEPFPQGAQRLAGDKLLLDLITQRRIAHDGTADLRKHLDHADRKLGPEGRTLRIVKRAHSLKIDLAVATAMGAARALEVLSNGAPGHAPAVGGSRVVYGGIAAGARRR
jgi:hypothetical protein